MSVNSEVEELIPAFAIGATDSEEASRVKDYLAQNPTAAAEFAEFSQMADALLFAAPLVNSPEGLESRLFATLGFDNETERISNVQNDKSRLKIATTDTKPTPGWRERVFGSSRTFQWALSFAVIALVLLINGYWIRQVNRLQQTQSALVEKLLQQQTTLSVIAMDESRRTVLPAVETGIESKADVIWGEGFDVALLYVEDFPQPEPGKLFQLWLIKKDQRTSGGVFTVNDKGTGTLIIQLPQPLDQYDTLGITSEPIGGSLAPSAPPIVRGPVLPTVEEPH